MGDGGGMNHWPLQNHPDMNTKCSLCESGRFQGLQEGTGQSVERLCRCGTRRGQGTSLPPRLPSRLALTWTLWHQNPVAVRGQEGKMRHELPGNYTSLRKYHEQRKNQPVTKRTNTKVAFRGPGSQQEFGEAKYHELQLFTGPCGGGTVP